MIHPDTELRLVSPSVGYGVFATARIPRGTLTWVLDALDIVLTPERAAALPVHKAILDRYAFIDSRGRRVLCWDFGRFMNHSCDPSCVCLGSLCDVAARDVEVGEQLTCEYGILNLPEAFACRCGAPRCRATVGAAPATSADEIDAVAQAAAAAAGAVAQPLEAYMLGADRARFRDIVEGRAPVPSCRENLVT